MDSEQIFGWIGDNLPQTILLAGGLLAVCIAFAYAKDKDGLKYKGLTALGFVFGAVMLFEALTEYVSWTAVTSVLVALTAFTLIIRPFRDVNFSVIAALIAAAFVYILLGSLNGFILFGAIDLTPLSEGWVRLIIAFIVGAFTYGICRFAEAVVKFVGKVLNCWPVLLVLGLVCVAEAVLMFAGYGSIMDYINFNEAGQSLNLKI